MVRMPVVAGQFYPGTREALRKSVESFLVKKVKKEEAIGAVSPHAGYVYSGKVAGSVISTLEPKGTYIILGPNHTGLGRPFGLDTSTKWATPLGEVSIDKELADELVASSDHIRYDNVCHSHEHSIEVQIPFFQVLQNDFKIVPIVISYAPLEVYQKVGREIADAIKKLRVKDTLIVASSDMTHYEQHDEAKRKDRMAIDAILELDEAKLVRTVDEAGITMCGYAPTAIMITAAKELGARNARLVNYQTSGDASGDYTSVVGYAGIVVT